MWRVLCLYFFRHFLSYRKLQYGNSGSVLYTSIFSAEGKFDRGLGYFSAIAPSIKASINILLVPQMQEVSKLLLFMVFVPFTVMVVYY